MKRYDQQPVHKGHKVKTTKSTKDKINSLVCDAKSINRKRNKIKMLIGKFQNTLQIKNIFRVDA